MNYRLTGETDRNPGHWGYHSWLHVVAWECEDENHKLNQEGKEEACIEALLKSKCVWLRQEPQGSSDFRLRSQGPCRLGTGESGLVLG